MKNTLEQPSRGVRRTGYKKLQRCYSLLFLAPWAAFFLIFKLYPFIYGFVISFTNYTLKSSSFIGLSNYKKIFSDSAVWSSLRATFFYALLCVPGTIIIALLFSRAIFPRSDFYNSLSKSILYLPSLICSVVIVVIVKYLFSTSIGFLPWLCDHLGIKVFSVFAKASSSIPLMSFLIVFLGVGQPVVLYTAAMGGIPSDLYDAAAIDGATKKQIFYRITLPLLRPTTTLILVTTTIGALQIFVYPLLFTGGGPYYSTSTLMLLLYNSAFFNGQFGYSAAIGVVLFVITGILAAVQFRMTRRDSVEY